MSEDFEKLKQIGVQKIYEKTHISRANIEKILSKSFAEIHKVQFRGFVSILEREYNLNLKDLLDEYERTVPEDEYDIEHVLDESEDTTPNKKIILLILIVTIIIGYFVISNVLDNDAENIELNNSQIESAKQYIDLNNSQTLTDLNQTEDVNLTQENNVTNEQESQTSTKATRFEILTDRPLWMAYTEMDSLKKTQITIQNNIKLDPAKYYLLEFAHGFFKIDLGIEVKEYREIGKKYFKFENGELTELSEREFKKLHKGRT